MLTRYTAIVYTPSRDDRLHLIPVRKVRWGKVFSDIKNCWNWLQEKLSPVPNPFDLAWQQTIDELIFEGV